MDFQRLLSKMAELDQPVGEQAVQECGEPMMGNMSSMTPPPPPQHTPPSLSLNLNAQGMEDIEGILKLMTKVNPDMINQPSPAMQGPDVLMPHVAPIPTIGGDNPSDVSAMASLRDIMTDKPEGEEDSMEPVDGDEMNPDHEAGESPEFEKGEEEGEEEEGEEEETDEAAYGNSVAGHDGQEMKGGEESGYPFNANGTDLNKPKQAFPKVNGGDNPRAMQHNESKDALRASIRAELLSRLQEGKDEGKPGKNFAKIAKKAAKEYGSKAAGERVAGAVRAKLAKQGKL